MQVVICLNDTFRPVILSVIIASHYSHYIHIKTRYSSIETVKKIISFFDGGKQCQESTTINDISRGRNVFRKSSSERTGKDICRFGFLTARACP